MAEIAAASTLPALLPCRMWASGRGKWASGVAKSSAGGRMAGCRMADKSRLHRVLEDPPRGRRTWGCRPTAASAGRRCPWCGHCAGTRRATAPQGGRPRRTGCIHRALGPPGSGSWRGSPPPPPPSLDPHTPLHSPSRPSVDARPASGSSIQLAPVQVFRGKAGGASPTAGDAPAGA